MNENLVRLGHVQTVFFENLIHELKSPLAVIASGCGVSAMLIKRGKQDDRILDRLSLAESEAVRLGKLIDRTSAVSFTSATAVSVTEEKILSILRDAALFCEPICQKRGNRIDIQCGESDLLYCDRDLILQVLYNLVINANRHTENSVILLTGGTDDRQTMITVTDHGDGISPELLDKVFERGFSGDGSTGYGLSICRTIMDMHHGDISIRAGVDGGTVVEIVIYRKDNEDAENPAD
jgi:signal transduction histidine kinase